MTGGVFGYKCGCVPGSARHNLGMTRKASPLSRRRFIKASSAAVTAAATCQIVPRHVVGGPGKVPPSETFGGALIGVGGRGPSTYKSMCRGLNVRQLALCDVKFLERADNKKVYTDFRRVLERKDIDLIAIATPPHWHALISIAAAEAGKDVLCEKPMNAAGNPIPAPRTPHTTTLAIIIPFFTTQ